MIERRYYLHRKSLTYRVVHIEPEREYCYEICGDEHHLIYNEMDPNTGNRTGMYYRASDLFKTEQECKDALIVQIQYNIKKLRREINKLEKRRKELKALIKE